jgi:tetratricopeptide (TPR) repeat protein
MSMRNRTEARSMPALLQGTVLIMTLGLSPCLLGAPATSLEQLFQQAKVHLREGNAQLAYDLLAPREADLAGTEAFDYLFGVAALDSQHPGEAIFSLQRLVAISPNFAGGRLELARAYFDIGDNELAKVEFQRVTDENPPPNVVAAVEQYQRAIAARASSYETTTQFYFDFGGGYDSNAPAATSDQNFLGFIVADNNLETPSSFSDLAIGGFMNRPLSKTTSLLFTGRLDHRINPSAHFVDASNFDLGAAWNWQDGDNGFSVGVNNLFSALDREYNRQDIGLMTSYMRQAGDDLQLSTFVRVAQSRFKNIELKVQDVDQLMYGVSASKSFSDSQMNLSLTGNRDEAVEATSPFSADGYGLNFTNIWFRPGGSQHTVAASLSRKDFVDTFFGLERKDDVFSLTASSMLPKFPTANWVTTFHVNYSIKDSTVGLFEYNRVEAGVSFRRVVD